MPLVSRGHLGDRSGHYRQPSADKLAPLHPEFQSLRCQIKYLASSDRQPNAQLLTTDRGVVRFSYTHDGVPDAMTRAELQKVVTDVLLAVVEAVGASPPELNDTIRPIGTLPNFDSILAEDTTVELFERLGLDPQLDVNPFIAGSRAASVAEVVDKLYDLVLTQRTT